jgi:hypothetical protein
MSKPDNDISQNLRGKPEGKHLFGRLRSVWEDNIELNFKKLYVKCTGWKWFRLGTFGGIF